MIIEPKKKEAIDKEAFRIMELLEVSEDTNYIGSSQKGSLGHQKAQDLSEKIIDTPTLIQTTRLEKTLAIKECYKGKCIGFNEASYKQFKNFVSSMHNARGIKELISSQFIEQKSFEWLLKTFKNKQADQNFSSYLHDEMLSSIGESKIHFQILHLDIEQSFKIGEVTIEFFTKEYFDLLFERFKSESPEITETSLQQMRSQYHGKVYATCTVRAEKERGKEIAFEKCALAIDILKICSDTADIPNARLSFDIDRRTKEVLQYEVILINDAEKNPFNVEVTRLPLHHQIYKNDWARILNRQFNDFHNFLLTLPAEQSELQQLIINAIKRYGSSISNPNLYQRVVELFTILESLVLTNADVPIMNSVCNYCSKLVFKKPEERKDVIALLKSMYSVRSAFIHHAKEREIPSDQIRKFQVVVRILLTTLIKKSKQHSTKESLLQEIDEAILNAY